MVDERETPHHDDGCLACQLARSEYALATVKAWSALLPYIVYKPAVATPAPSNMVVVEETLYLPVEVARHLLRKAHVPHPGVLQMIRGVSARKNVVFPGGFWRYMRIRLQQAGRRVSFEFFDENSRLRKADISRMLQNPKYATSPNAFFRDYGIHPDFWQTLVRYEGDKLRVWPTDSTFVELYTVLRPMLAAKQWAKFTKPTATPVAVLLQYACKRDSPKSPLEIYTEWLGKLDGKEDLQEQYDLVYPWVSANQVLYSSDDPKMWEALQAHQLRNGSLIREPTEPIMQPTKKPVVLLGNPDASMDLPDL